MTEYFKKVRNIVAEKAAVEPEEVQMESYFEDDLNMGEMELAEAIAEIEDLYQIEFDEDEKDSLATVGDLVEILVEKLE